MKLDKILEKFEYQKQLDTYGIIPNPIRNIRPTDFASGNQLEYKAQRWNEAESIQFINKGHSYFFYIIPDNGQNFYIKKKVWEAAYRSTLPVRLLSNV